MKCQICVRELRVVEHLCVARARVRRYWVPDSLFLWLTALVSYKWLVVRLQLAEFVQAKTEKGQYMNDARLQLDDYT